MYLLGQHVQFSFEMELSQGKSWVQVTVKSGECLLASSRWEPALLGRPSPSEARLGCKLTHFAEHRFYLGPSFLLVHSHSFGCIMKLCD